MSYTATVDAATIQQWINAKLEPQAIEQELLVKGFDASAIASHLKEYRRLKNAKKQFTGFVCMAIGAFLGFISCVLTILNPVPELYNIILFGLTSLAILIIFLGLYFVFE
ncbi:MAG: hypothetical protein IPP72_18000 [Chitinophagaceae bacterium]|nr:hypothetical protein [Chitinophagaceae bacterium]